MTSSSGVWAVGGSRSLSQAGQAVAQYVTREMLASGARLAVGCCMGADAAVIRAAILDGHARRLAIFSVFGPLATSRGAVAAAGVCASSAVGTVAAAVDLGAAIVPWAGGGPDLHIKARLRARTSRVAAAATAGGVIFTDGTFGPGSLLLASHLAAKGCPVFAVTLAPLVPAPGPGSRVISWGCPAGGCQPGKVCCRLRLNRGLAVLGPSEDFDGLVTEVQDLAERAEFDL